MRRASVAIARSMVAAAVPAAQQKSEDVVNGTAKPPSAALVPGATAAITLSAEIADGWYL